jgi:lysozyme family protein
MADFLPAVTIVLKQEGGWCNDAADSGGETNLGLTWTDLNAAIKAGIVSRGTKIKDLTQSQATDIYKELYWDAHLNLNNINNQSIANKLFSEIVNLGPYPAVLIIQKAINTNNGNIQEDGKFGPHTLDAINNVDSDALLTSYKKALCSYYRSIVIRNPKDEIFLKGWLARANS